MPGDTDVITVVWVVLALVLCAGFYAAAAARILARDDMPLTRQPIVHFSNLPRSQASPAGAARVAPETSQGKETRILNAPAGESSYQVLYAMASAVNDAWLDRLFAGNAS